jgi:hypothetical protein
MANTGYLVRDESVVWRDIAGEVVIAEKNNTTIHVLNRTAGLIWTLADGTRQVEDIAGELCNQFDVTQEEAMADTNEFCRQLIDAGLVSLRVISRVI